MLVTHHVEEIPPGFTHVLLLRDGRVLAAGPIDDLLTAEALSACFGLPLTARARGDGRFERVAPADAAAAAAGGSARSRRRSMRSSTGPHSAPP